MADISVTAGSVLKDANAVIRTGTAGATITAGQVLYQDAVTGKLLLAQADGTAAEARAVGIALGGGSDGQPIDYQIAGDITIGGTCAAGLAYFVSGTAGGLSPHTDVTTPASTEYGTVVGVGISTTKIRIGIVYGGAVA